MNVWVAAVPLAVVVIGALVLHRPAWQMAVAALLATAAATAIAGRDGFAAAITGSLGAGGLLALDAGLVIASGMLLNELLRRSGGHGRMLAWIKSWPVNAPVAALIMTTAFGPALESLAGFGVSLLVTVPVLLGLLPRGKALAASLLSLTIMPWGTAGLATRTAANLTGLNERDLGFVSSLISFAVFPVFAVVVALVVGERGQRRQPIAVAIALGCTFSAVLVAMNAADLVSLASVTAGAVAGILAYVVLVRPSHTAAPPPWHTLAPYGVAVAVIVLLHALDALTGWGTRLVVHAGQVTFAPLLSPAIALLVAATLLHRTSPGWGTLVTVVGGAAWKPITALFGFAVTSELLNTTGAVAGLGALVARSGPVGYVLLVPLLGIASGYLAGSGTAANALMSTTQAAIGAQFGATLATVALQNSAAGHAVFASLPETLVVLGIAGDATRAEESRLLRLGVRTLGTVLVIAVAAGALILVAR